MQPPILRVESVDPSNAGPDQYVLGYHADGSPVYAMGGGDGSTITVDQARDLVRDAVADAVRAINPPDASARPSAGPNVNLGRPQQFSLSRTITALRSGSWVGAELERDVVQATASVLRDSPDKNAVVVPWTAMAFRHVVEQAAIRGAEFPAIRTGANEASTAAGLALVPPQYLQDQFTLSLQGPVAFRNAPGVDVIPVTSNSIFFPRETVMPTGAAYAEAATITESDPTFAQQNIIIKKQASLNQFSNELLADATPAYEQYLARSLSRSLALLQDLQYLEGSGSGANITGLGSYSGLTTGYAAATNGDSYAASTAADNLINLVYLARAAGWEPNAWIMHPRTMQSLSKVKDSNGRYLLESVGGNFGAPVMVPNAGALPTAATYVPPVWKAMLLGYPVLFSNQIPINETQGTSSAASHLYLGDFNFARVLERSAIELAVSEHILFTTDQTAVRVASRTAIVLTQPAAFIKQGGIIA